MKTKTLSLILLLGITHFSYGQKKTDSTPLKHRPVDIGLIYPISTNGVNAAQYSNSVSFQALAGVSGAVTGGALAGVANIIRENGNGVVIAGVLNTIGNNAQGTQIAGIANRVKHHTTGVQMAGIINQSESIQGIQLAGIGNITSGQSKAIQFAGLFNHADHVQAQIAGLINVADKVSGIQMSGLINIADSSDYPIGFINLINNGEKSIGISTTDNLNTMLSFYSGSKDLYGIIGIGYYINNKNNIYGLQTGIGSHIIHSGSHFRLNAEALQLFQTDFSGGHCFTYTLQTLPEVKIGSHLSVFAGPAVHLQLDYSKGKISGLTSHHFWNTTGKNVHFIGAYFGITGGLKYIL